MVKFARLLQRPGALPVALWLLSLSVLLTASCRGTLSNPQGTGPSAGVTWTTNALTTAAQVANTAVPAPWGGMLSALFGLSNAGLIAWSALQQRQIRDLKITVASNGAQSLPVTAK